MSKVPPARDEREPHLRGILVSMSIQWFIDAFGIEAHRRALAALPREDRARFDRILLSVGWQPFGAWYRMIEAHVAEAQRLGVSADEYDRRAIEGTGGTLIRTLFQTILARTNAQSMIARSPMLYRKFFDQGEAIVEENLLGYARLRLCIPEGVWAYATRYMAPTMSYYLRLSGCQDVSASISQVEGAIIIEYRYRATPGATT